jgi:endonuclease/exonuclease/phosphatase family metal-dependent hydrolase
MKIRVLTYNIHGAVGVDGTRDFKRIGQFLREQNIDIALLQEFDTRSQHHSTEEDIQGVMGNHFFFHEAAPTIRGRYGWYGNAIFSKYPIAKSSVIDISTPGREPRNIIEALIDTPNGPLHVVNTHKGLRLSERTLQLTILHKLLDTNSEIPLIVGGDLNEWSLFAGPLKKINSVLQPITPGPTFPTLYPLFQLDRMWCRPRNLVARAAVLKTKETRKYSDHYPILAELEL